MVPLSVVTHHHSTRSRSLTYLLTDGIAARGDRRSCDISFSGDWETRHGGDEVICNVTKWLCVRRWQLVMWQYTTARNDASKRSLRASLRPGACSISIQHILYSTKRQTPSKRRTDGRREWNLVHFSRKIWHLLAIILMIFLTINWPNFVYLSVDPGFSSTT